MTTPAIHITFDGLSGVDGSARFSFGTTTALASVSGPIAPRPATEHPARAAIDVHVRPLTAVPGTAERHIAVTLRGILERACILAQHPRTAVQVVVQALSSPPPPLPSSSSPASGTDKDVDLRADVRLATEINAASLALLNAGSVPMRGVVCAVAVAVTDAQPASGSASAPQPLLVTEPGRGDLTLSTGCFAFLFGVDATHTDAGTTASAPPAKLIWTNYRAGPGHGFSATALALAEQIALEGATFVWAKMKESLTA